MTKDIYWDELSIAWTALGLEEEQTSMRLKERLRRQTFATTAVLVFGIPLALAGAALGAWTIWLGASTGAWNFIARGTGIVIISLMMGIAAWSFKSAWRDNSQAMGAMIELALARAERLHLAMRLGLVSCVTAALFGLAGYAIRTNLGKPPAMSPIEPLLMLALLGFALVLLQRRAQADIAKYRYLKRIILKA